MPISTVKIQVSQLLSIELMDLGLMILECMNIKHHQKLVQCTPSIAVLLELTEELVNLLMFLINFKEQTLTQFGGADTNYHEQENNDFNDLIFQGHNFSFYESISENINQNK